MLIASVTGDRAGQKLKGKGCDRNVIGVQRELDFREFQHTRSDYSPQKPNIESSGESTKGI
jgi:hypothetical protein